jgi:hypothetical protein
MWTFLSLIIPGLKTFGLSKQDPVPKKGDFVSMNLEMYFLACFG